MRRLVVLLAGAVMLVGAGFAAQPANAAPVAPVKAAVHHVAASPQAVTYEALPASSCLTCTYTYTKTLQCIFPFWNWVPHRLVIEHSSSWKHVYRLQFGTLVGTNAEQIRWITLRQAQPNGTWMGNWYSQAFVNVTGGATAAIGSGYTPWIPNSQAGNAFVEEQNIHDDVCGNWFPTSGTSANSGGNW